MRRQIPVGRNAIFAVLALVLVLAAAAAVLSTRGSSTGLVTATAPTAPPAATVQHAPAAHTVAPPKHVLPVTLTPLQGGAFNTSYNSKWHVWRKITPAGAHRIQLSNSTVQPSKLGIPSPGTVGVTIDESTVAFLAALRLPASAAGRSTLALIPHFVGTPSGAKDITLASAPLRSHLGGAEAAIESYAYTYHGVDNIQIDILSHHAAHFVLIELDTEPGFAASGEAALEALGKHWRWH